MRSFYLRIRVYAIEECGPKFVICDFFIHLPRVYAIVNEKKNLKIIFLIKNKNLINFTVSMNPKNQIF